MNKIYVGRIVNTHGIKGELRIRSDFEFKDKVFTINNKLIIDDKEYIIRSYRKHKTFDMVMLNDYKDINDVLFLKGKNVYIDKENLKLNNNEVLDEDLLNYKVLTEDKKEGKVIEVFFSSPTNKVIRVLLDKEILIPYNKEFITIDKSNNTIIIKMPGGM